MLKSKRFDPKKFYKKGSSSTKNEKFAKATKIYYKNKIESNKGPGFGCGLPGHIAKDYPILQKKAEKRKENGKQDFKRAIITTWSDSDSSDSENEEEQVTNLCFMVNEGQIQEEEIEYESSDEVNYLEFLE